MDSKPRSDRDGANSGSEQIAFVQQNGKYYSIKQTKLKNSLLAIVGWLELANAMDFAANVWNQVPVPLFATILMGIGGFLAISISFFAFRDAALSKRNVMILWDERRRLKKLKADANQEMGNVPDIDAHIDVTFRELGTEIIDRIGMDCLMGFAAILVGTGTLMAIGGANQKVYKASNSLSGYIGNTLSAFYGVVNAGWSIFTWRRAHRHAVAGARYIIVPDVKFSQKQRTYTIELHAALNGLTGLVAGIAGIITATRWWGYVVLVPCIISAIYCNSIWRRKIGYERPMILHNLGRDVQKTVEDIKFAALAQNLLREAPLMAFDSLVANNKSISNVLDFLVMNGFFEDFCNRLLENPDVSTALLGPLHSKLTVNSLDLLTAEEHIVPDLLAIADLSIRETGSARFQDRERFLLDKLGCQLCVTGFTEANFEMTERSEPKESSVNTGIFATPASTAERIETIVMESVDDSPKETPEAPSLSVSQSGQ